MIFAGFSHEPAVRLAERLLDILPGDFSKIFYSDNGSTAVEVAIKMAVQYWWNDKGTRESGVGSGQSVTGRSEPGGVARNKVLALRNAYHGDTFGAMSVSDRGIFTLAFQDKLFDVMFIDTADLGEAAKKLSSTSSPDSGFQTPDSILTLHPDQIACFIYEPLIQGAGGMRMYEAEILNQFIRTLKASGIICIADEVMTGFGRTGKLFASGYMAEKPDIICLSKGLTGGAMAMGVTACSKKIHDAFVTDEKLKTFFHGHSYTANPLACTAALASLDLLVEPGCLERIENIHRQHQTFLAELQTTNQKLQTKNHRCLGTIVAFEIETGKDDYLNNISTTITRLALSKGVFIRPLGNTVYIMPPYCITESELQKIYEVIIEILNEA